MKQLLIRFYLALDRTIFQEFLSLEDRKVNIKNVNCNQNVVVFDLKFEQFLLGLDTNTNEKCLSILTQMKKNK